MTIYERRQSLSELLPKQTGLRVPELVRASGISEGTVRNALNALTVYYLARQLSERQRLRVVTNGIDVARLMAQYPTKMVILLGGRLAPMDRRRQAC